MACTIAGLQPPALLRDRRVAKLALAALALAFVVTHLVAERTASINWDEFALLQRAERAVTTDFVDGGGRPGLAVIALVPFARDCTATIPTVRGARLLWAIVTFGLLGGLFAFLRLAVRRAPEPGLVAAFGTALLGLVPNFLQWSLHVRTDQPALACALWGGVALFAARRRPAWSIAAGVLCGTGYLFSQKAVYIVALVLLVVAGDVFVEGKLAWRREALRVGGLIAGAVAAVAGFYLLVPVFYTPKAAVSVDVGLQQFDWYRRALGYRAYVAMLPTVYPHIVALVLLVAATVRAARHDGEHKRSLLVALAVMASGFAVGRFHAATFPYFWMTLGIFFAMAIAIGWPGIRGLLGRAHLPVLAGLWVWLVVIAVPARMATLVDTQAIQQDAFAFVDRDFDLARRGFHPDGAFFCRKDPDPIPGRFVTGIQALYTGPRAARNIAAFLGEHRTRPIEFLVDTPRLIHYPEPIRTFWRTHYVPYYGPVQIAGSPITGVAGATQQIDIIVPGRYRWFTRGEGAGRITIDGREVAGAVVLGVGSHTVALVDAVAEGMLALAVADPPRVTRVPFYATPGDLTYWVAHPYAPWVAR